jgi:hypothetical protein
MSLALSSARTNPLFIAPVISQLNRARQMDGFSNHTTAYHQAMSFFWYTKNIKDARE